MLYGGNNNWFAAYAYWYFKLYGHDKVVLLDGGRKKWELDRRALTDERLASPRRHYYRRRSPTSSIRAFRDEVVAAIGVEEPRRRPLARRVRRPAARARRTCRRSGAARRAHPDGGQHPVEQGGERGRHLPVRGRADDALLRGRASTSDKDTIAYCRIGERSAHTWFVLHELLEQPNVKNYDGSWTEYGSLVGVPVAVGDEPGGGLTCAERLRAGRPREGVDLATQSIIQGAVVREDEPVGHAYVRLLDRTGEFTAEVPTGATGEFRFFAAPGEWTVRALAPSGHPADLAVRAVRGEVAEVKISVG